MFSLVLGGWVREKGCVDLAALLDSQCRDQQGALEIRLELRERIGT